MNVLLPILAKFGQWNDLIISQLQADFQHFSSYPPLGRVLSIQLINVQKLVMQAIPVDSVGEMFFCSKIVAKSFGDGNPDICKYKERNLEPVAGF